MDKEKLKIRKEQEDFKNLCKTVCVALICVTVIIIACIIRDCVTKGMW